MSKFIISGRVNLSKNTIGFGEVNFKDCKIIFEDEVIEEDFTGSFEELKERHPETEF